MLILCVFTYTVLDEQTSDMHPVEHLIPEYMRNVIQARPLGQFRDYSPWALRVTCPEGMTPTRSSAKSAGYDLRAAEDMVVPARGSVVVDTGVAVALPSGHFGKIEGRSGLGIRHDIVAFGGVIDEDYRGTIAVKLFNFSDTDYEIKARDRVAQMVVQPYAGLTVQRVASLDATVRGTAGFGSSGR